MQHVELAYLAVAYGMAGIMFLTTRYKTFPTFSHIALDSKLTRRVFFWGLTLSGLLFAVLMYGWVIPHFELGIFIKILVGVLIVCQILTGYFPVKGMKFDHPHAFFGSALAICMFILIVLLASTPTIHDTARWINGLLAGFIAVLALISTHVVNGEYVLHEKLFFGCWHVAILATVYLG